MGEHQELVKLLKELPQVVERNFKEQERTIKEIATDVPQIKKARK
jgi:hypothetical protein